MIYLVDANVLSEAIKPRPDPQVLAWLTENESDFVVDAIVLGAALEHHLTLATHNARDFQKAGVRVFDPFA